MPIRTAAAIAALIVFAVALAAAVGGNHPRVRHVPAGESSAAVAVDLHADRLHVVLAHDGLVYGIEDHFVYVSEDTGRTYRRLGRLPKSGTPSARSRLKDLVARTAIVRHFRRNAGPKGMLVLRSGTILVFYDRIYRSTNGGRTFHAVPGTSEDHLPSAFPSSLGYAASDGDTVYYGEYTVGQRPRAVRVIQGTHDGQEWKVIHTFPPGVLFHIHSVTWDSLRQRFWIAAGDIGDEPQLAYTDDHFASVHTVGCCRQEWRFVDMIVTDSALYWGTDDDHHHPGIYRFDIAANRLDRVADLDNPSYHAARLADGSMAITTTYEPSSPFTRSKQPPAVTSLWISEDGRAWQKAMSWQANAANVAARSRPQLQVPHGDPLPALFLTPWHTEKDEFVALRLRFSRPPR